MNTETPARSFQKKFDFSSPRPFLSNLPEKIDTYEEGVASYFHWRTGLDYYLTIDQIVDFVVNTERMRVIDILTDTAAFALKLAGRRAFHGHIFSFDSNITLLERAKQRAAHLNIHRTIEFRQSQELRIAVPDGYGDLVVSIFDLHRHPAEQYLAETIRILASDGHLILAEILEPRSARTAWSSWWKKLHLRYIKKNPAEARAVYPDRDEIIELLFKAGYRQVIIQGLNAPASPHSGVFSLIAATK